MIYSECINYRSSMKEMKVLDSQIDYAVGIPLSLLDEMPIADSRAPSPGILIRCNKEADSALMTLEFCGSRRNRRINSARCGTPVAEYLPQVT
jgi:hypothetical protein